MTIEAPNQGSRFVPRIDKANAAPERPTDELDRIPRSVPASKITAFLADLGLCLNDIPSGDANALRISGTCITVTIAATNDDGHWYVDLATDEIAVHHITIPVVDDQAQWAASRHPTGLTPTPAPLCSDSPTPQTTQPSRASSSRTRPTRPR